MDGSGGSFVAMRRISQGFDQEGAWHSSSGEEECLQRLQNRIAVTYDASKLEHQESLQALRARLVTGLPRGNPLYPSANLGWNSITNQCHITSQSLFQPSPTLINHPNSYYSNQVTPTHPIPVTKQTLRDAAFPGMELHGLISEQWKEMGWQGKDPSTDFRGGGFISLENLVYFAKTFPKSFQSLLLKQEGERALVEYPFAVAGVNITFMLIQMLDIHSPKLRSMVASIFLKLLSENERAFDLIYCIAFKLMDRQWLAMGASYMDFNSVMKSTRRQLERELLLEYIQRLEDMPSYSLLER